MAPTIYIIVFTLITQLSATERHSAGATATTSSQADRAEAQGPVGGAPLIQKAMDASAARAAP
jgi:hypothetical protein